jgi:hypothetical protein
MLPLVSLAWLLAMATASVAFIEVPERARLEIPRAGWEDEGLWIQPTEIAGQAKSSPLGDFTARYGGNWRFNRNAVTGSLHRVYGSGVNFTSAIVDDAGAERAAREFIGANASLFGAAIGDLRAAAMQHVPGKWAAHFEQTAGGVTVLGGRVHVVFTESGRLFAFGSDVYPDVEASLGGTRPSLSEADAIAIAGAEVGFVHGTDQVMHTELLILPTREARDDELVLVYHLAYRVDLFPQNPYGYWSTYVDARSGEILWREDLIHTVDFVGHVQGDVEWESYCDGQTADFPVDGMRITISGVGTTYSAENGDFTLSYGGSGSASISAEFRGLYINVNRYTGGDAVHNGTIVAGTPYTIDWSQANSIYSERDCFSYINKQHRWLKNLDPAFTGLDYEMPCSVERTDGYCPGNAWYDYNGINFCAQSATYGNTGRMSDVAYHEYGHGITHRMYNSTSIPNSTLHEGNSDIAANVLTRESIIGLGFYLNNCTSGIRNSNNNLVYPDDQTGEGHHDGQIIAGFIWDAWEALLGAYAQDYADSVLFNAWHFGRKLGLPTSMPDQVYWTFVEDDDDGDLDNGTPHHAMFCVGATNHGFDCPEILGPVSITHTPVESQPSTTQPTAITATITSTAAPINESACRVYYKINGGAFQNVGMSNVGGDDYTGNIPAQTAGTFVQYYVYGQDNDGNSATHPSTAPVTLHPFYVGEFQLVVDETFESAGAWTVGAAGDAATTGVWERGDPQGTSYGGPVQPEDDHTPAPGVNCYATQLAAGSSAGTYDVDGGRTTLTSPAFDLSGASMVLVSYWRWYSNSLGNNPGEDYWRVQVSDDGATWVYLENTTSDDNSWQKFIFSVGDFVDLTSTVQFRFIAADEANPSLVEAAVDDLKIEAIFPPGVDPDLSTVEANDDVMLRPDGLGDSTLTIKVTVRNADGDPVAGIPAGDVVVDLVGTSLNGQSMIFCAGGTNALQLSSTAPTNADGEALFSVTNAGGCADVAVTATVQSVALTNGDVATMRSPDLNGNGVVNFQDTFLYAALLYAGTGYCGNLDGSPDGVVNFSDTVKYLPALAAGASCP